MKVIWEFSKPKWTMVWEQPGVQNSEASPATGARPTPATKATLVVIGGDGGCDTEQKGQRLRSAERADSRRFWNRKKNVDPTERHRRNWRRCIKTREKAGVMDVEIGVKMITLPIIANIAYTLGRKLTYDPKTWKFINDDEANRLLYEPDAPSLDPERCLK